MMGVKNLFFPAMIASVSVFASACGVFGNQNAEMQSDFPTAEEQLYSSVTDSEFEALGLKADKKKSLAEKAKSSIGANKKVSANTQARSNNVNTALTKLREVRGMQSKGLMQAQAKCDAISAAVDVLKKTNSPKRPFDGLRKQFRNALKAERDGVLKVNGFTSCGKVRNAVASRPAQAPAPQTLADEVVPASDPGDEVALAPAEI
jgi:hypothetical protein